MDFEKKKFSYSVLDHKELLKDMEETVTEISTELHLPLTETRSILDRFGWEKDKLLKEHYNGKKFYAHGGLGGNYSLAKAVRKPLFDEEHFCGICYREYKPNNMRIEIDCGHPFCTGCYEHYVSKQILTLGVAQITCLHPNCNFLLDKLTTMRLITNDRARETYEQILLNNYVQVNRLLRWCPSVGCTYAVKVSTYEVKPVICKCGYKFCFGCGEIWHYPLPCRLLNAWTTAYLPDSATGDWIQKNTKKCPKCAATIEKDGGCMVVKCKNGLCKHSFCWICRKSTVHHIAFAGECASNPTKSHYTFSQNRCLSDDSRNKHLLDEVESGKTFRSKISQKIEKLKTEISQQSQEAISVSAAEITRGLYVMMTTYVFAHYLIPSRNATPFYDNRRYLEAAINSLSELLEQKITGENEIELIEKIKDQTRLCQTRCEDLCKHIQTGFEKGWWLFIQ